MNWQDILKNAELVYASTLDDIGFRTWSLKKTTYNISFYEEHQIEDFDKIVCSILKSNSGSIEQKRFATILGFNVLDNFEVEPKRYADSAELDVFNLLIQPVIDWGLIEFYDGYYTLTELGEKVLIEEKKYEFFTGEKILFENPNLRPSDSIENLFFPFNTALGVYSEITNKKKIEYKKINISEIFPVDETDLIKRHKQQSNEEYYIYQSQESPYFKFDSCQVDIRLFKQDGVYIPIVFYNESISIQASELLNKSDNIIQKEKKVEWALYLKLIKDPKAKLDYETIIPFEDLLDLDSLILDKRLVWNDKKLFTYLAQNANADQWFAISNECPVEILKLYFNKYKSELDWTTLSSRIDDDFLINNATHFPWNYGVISAKEDISIEVVKTLLLIPELKEEEWDWDVIMPQLDFQFIKSNIDKVNFELGELTKNISDAAPLISKFPSKKWDWIFISNDYDLSYILENVLNFSEHLNLINTLNRAFTSSEHVELYCNSQSLKEVLAKYKEDKLMSYAPNQLNYVWSESLINLLESSGYLTWASGNYTLGFECNPYLEWTYDFFGKYTKKVVTDKGFDFLSSHITDTRIISDYIQFNWNWDLISTNTNLINQSAFILEFKDRLNYNLLLPEIKGETLEIIFQSDSVLKYLEENPDKWSDITEKPSREFILKNIDLNWDWKILTKRFCSTIKIESLGNPNWIDKWDWVYLTQNLDFNNVLDELDLYVDRWDWEYISKEADKQFILNNLPEYNEHWNWEILLNERFEKVDLEFNKLIEIATCISVLDIETNTSLWQVITEKFDYEDLESLIRKTKNIEVFNWNYSFFYDLPDFSPLNYLGQNYDYISWEAFSSSKSLNKSLKWNKNLFSYGVWINKILNLLNSRNYNWDFKSLSKLDSINWNTSVLSIQTTYWDWEYLSEYSSCFRKDKGFEDRFNEFIDFIDFQYFSKRIDSDINEELLDEYIDKNWNWKTLSCNDSVKFTITFISKHKDKNWDWEYLSSRNDIEFKNELFLDLSNKEWNWEEISKRSDIEFSEELIKSISNKPLDWMLVSQSETFEPNANVLSLLKGKELDWYSISSNPNLSLDILWDYRELLDWELVTKNRVIKFSDISFLKKFQNLLNWNYISSSQDFNISIENLKQFKNKLEWSTICDREDFIISEELLQPFADVLNWSIVSRSMDIQITSELIEKFRDYWDWQELRKNPQIIEKFDSTLKKYQTEFNCVDFLERFDRQPFIYHFTHLFNAIDIIKKRKILSRNKAEGNFANAAGNLVDRRNTAHGYARFYFRPHTPTQFYNECLGWDDSLITSWGKSYYTQARNLGLPKCPIPVFFKFDLKEVLMKMPSKCFYSTGNMQTNWSQVKNVSNDPDSLNVTYLYANPDDFENYKQYAQQEFLVEEEFDFSTLDSFEIICYNEEYENILKAQLGDDPICKKINSDGMRVYHRGNRELLISQTDSEISIESEYKDSAHILIKGEGINELNILESEHIQRETKTEIIAYPKIKFVKTKRPLEVYFVDTAIGKRDWLIYKN